MKVMGDAPMFRIRSVFCDTNEMNDGSSVRLGVLSATSTF